MSKAEEVDEMMALAEQLSAEVPWSTCGKLFTHESWFDLVETIKAVSPAAYAALVHDLVKEK
jgi:hypothetical protein